MQSLPLQTARGQFQMESILVRRRNLGCDESMWSYLIEERMVLQSPLLAHGRSCKISHVPTYLPLSKPNIEIFAHIYLNKIVQKIMRTYLSTIRVITWSKLALVSLRYCPASASAAFWIIFRRFWWLGNRLITRWRAWHPKEVEIAGHSRHPEETEMEITRTIVDAFRNVSISTVSS